MATLSCYCHERGAALVSAVALRDRSPIGPHTGVGESAFPGSAIVIFAVDNHMEWWVVQQTSIKACYAAGQCHG